jgi:hypothetical protein
MSAQQNFPHRVGELRPNQFLFNYGVGALVDLPKFAVLVKGLEEWPISPLYTRALQEERLIAAIQARHPSLSNIVHLYTPPIPPKQQSYNPLDAEMNIGVPTTTFPQWMVCPKCNLLAPYAPGKAGHFELKHNPFRPMETRFVHHNCLKHKKGPPPQVVPARFLYACPQGHLDDFPWVAYVHQGAACGAPPPRLELYEFDDQNQASRLFVVCKSCGAKRAMSEAFDPKHRALMPPCSGRHPHIDLYEECEALPRAVLLGASNLWFPSLMSVLSIPVSEDTQVAQLVEEHWAVLTNVETQADLAGLRKFGGREIRAAIEDYSDAALWAAIAQRRDATVSLADPTDLKGPEWAVLTTADSSQNHADFKAARTDLSGAPLLQSFCEQVVLGHKLREVRALLGFTRITTADDETVGQDVQIAPLSSQPLTWVPAGEVRGEGIFIQFQEARIQAWLRRDGVKSRAAQFRASHRQWRVARGLDPDAWPFPEMMRYVLLHSFAHALMRALSLECGYSLASIRERIYAREAAEGQPAMAGVLIYTATNDAEGTLGGLARLGEPEHLEAFVARALETAEFCASDPLCAEGGPDAQGHTVHAAACHACSFVPETSCEMGNRFLDRSVLVPTVEVSELAFFDW